MSSGTVPPTANFRLRACALYSFFFLLRENFYGLYTFNWPIGDQATAQSTYY